MEELNTFLLTLILLILIYCMFKVKKETDETVKKFKPTNQQIVQPTRLYEVNQQKSRKSNGHKKNCVCHNGTPVSNFRCPGKGLQECNQCKPNYRLARVCVQNPPKKLY